MTLFFVTVFAEGACASEKTEEAEKAAEEEKKEGEKASEEEEQL